MKRRILGIVFIVSFFMAGVVSSQDVELELSIPETTLVPGSVLRLDVKIENHGDGYTNANLFVALDIGTSEYWFLPSWAQYPPNVDSFNLTLQGYSISRLNIIPGISWPEGAGDFSGARFIAALVSKDGKLISNLAEAHFDWASRPELATLFPASGPPGQSLVLTGHGFNLCSGNARVRIGNDLFPVVASGQKEGEEYLITVIPPLATGNYEVRGVVDGAESAPLELHVEAVASTNKPAGDVIQEISTGMTHIISHVKNEVIPDAVSRRFLPAEAKADFISEMDRVQALLDGAIEKLNTLPSEQLVFVESMLVQNGLDGVYSAITDENGSAESHGPVDDFYACLRFEAMSACLSAMDNGWRQAEPAMVKKGMYYSDGAVDFIGATLVLDWTTRILGAVVDGYLPSRMTTLGVTLDDSSHLWVLASDHYTNFHVTARFQHSKPPLTDTFDMLLTDFLNGVSPLVSGNFQENFSTWMEQFISDYLDVSLDEPVMGSAVARWSGSRPVELLADFEFISHIDTGKMTDLTFFESAEPAMSSLLQTFNTETLPAEVSIGNPEMLEYKVTRDMLSLRGKTEGTTVMELTGHLFGGGDIRNTACAGNLPTAERVFQVHVVPRFPPTPTPVPPTATPVPPTETPTHDPSTPTPTPRQIPTGFVYIPPGSFLMGSPEDELCRSSDEGPLHFVTISHGFYIQESEVTQQQWMDIFSSNPSVFWGFKRPVENVSWYKCCIYCNRLSLQDGLIPCYYTDSDFTEVFLSNNNEEIYWKLDANGYRLPTEAEWEYACRATRRAAYNNGRDNTNCEHDPVLDLLGRYWYSGGETRHHAFVKSYPPNFWRLFDMHGNVYEWCWDRYSEDYYTFSPIMDPMGPVAPVEPDMRVCRGGSWQDEAGACRSAARSCHPPGNRKNTIGFRLVLPAFDDEGSR